jgi:hypothetical protein
LFVYEHISDGKETSGIKFSGVRDEAGERETSKGM